MSEFLNPHRLLLLHSKANLHLTESLALSTTWMISDKQSISASFCHALANGDLILKHSFSLENDI